jgi:hypothetical protein
MFIKNFMKKDLWRAVSKLSTFFIHSSPKEIRKVKEGAPKKLNGALSPLNTDELKKKKKKPPLQYMTSFHVIFPYSFPLFRFRSNTACVAKPPHITELIFKTES